MFGMKCRTSIGGRLNLGTGWGQKPLSARGQDAILTTGWAIKMSETSSPTKTTMSTNGANGHGRFPLCATERRLVSGAIYCPEVPLSPVFLSQIWRLKIEMSQFSKKITIIYF